MMQGVQYVLEIESIKYNTFLFINFRSTEDDKENMRTNNYKKSEPTMVGKF